jgi:ribosome silencing factor RsfS/YbeB/iojap
VFDIEELVDILKRDSAENIFVCTVPKNIKYVDHMCIVTGRSYRHMIAMAEFVRKVFKLKRSSHDILPKIEGEKSKDWMALDLGNFIIHSFTDAE